MKFNKFVKGLVTLSAVAILAACGGRSSTSSTQSTSNKVSTLKVAVDEGYKAYIEKVKEAFEKENNVSVEVVTGDALKGSENLPLDNQAGTAPDVMMVPYDHVGKLGRIGAISKLAFSNESELDSTTKSAVMIDGSPYGEPAVIESVVLLYNKKLVNSAPKTFAELEALNKDSRFAFAGEAGKNTGFLAPFTNYYHTYGLLAGYGSYVFGKNGTDPKDVGVGNEGAVKAMEYQKTFYDVWPQGMRDVKTVNNFISTSFHEGKTAAMIDGPWVVAKLKEVGIDFGATTIPTLPNGEHYKSFGGGKAWIVPTGSKAQDLAKKFVAHLSSADNAKLFFDVTHEVPANLKARDYAKSKNDEVVTAVIEQYQYTQPMPSIPEMGEVWGAGETMLLENANGAKSAKQAAEDAVKFIKEQIAQKYGN